MNGTSMYVTGSFISMLGNIGKELLARTAYAHRTYMYQNRDTETACCSGIGVQQSPLARSCRRPSQAAVVPEDATTPALVHHAADPQPV